MSQTVIEAISNSLATQIKTLVQTEFDKIDLTDPKYQDITNINNDLRKLMQFKGIVEDIIQNKLSRVEPGYILEGLQEIENSKFYHQMPEAFKTAFKEAITPAKEKLEVLNNTPPYSWVRVGDYVIDSPEMQSKKPKEKEMLDRLGENGRKVLFGDPLPPQSSEKRKEFFEKYAQVLEKKREEINKDPKVVALKNWIAKLDGLIKSETDQEKLAKYIQEKEIVQQQLYEALPPIKMEEMFNEEIAKLYKEATEEENNSISFRTAVFMHATDNFYGPKFDPPVDFTLGGASGTGKSFATQILIFNLSRDSLLKQLDEIAKGYDSTKLKDNDRIKQINELKESLMEIDPYQGKKAFDAMKEKFEALADDELFLYDERIHQLKENCAKGNDVVAIDGGKEREMSQVRQIMLHGALSLGYPGISDLHSQSKKLSLKSTVKKAALAAEGEPFHTATPDTFAKKVKTSAVDQIEGRRPIMAFVDAYEEQTDISGTDRAYRKVTDPPYDPKKIKANTFPPVESKKYEPRAKIGPISVNAFERGYNNSLDTLKKSIDAGIECYHLNNKVIHVKEITQPPVPVPPENWVVCDKKNRKYDIKLNEVDFERWKQQVRDKETTKGLKDWHKEQKEAGKLQVIVITPTKTREDLSQVVRPTVPERPSSAPAVMQRRDSIAKQKDEGTKSRSSSFSSLRDKLRSSSSSQKKDTTTPPVDDKGTQHQVVDSQSQPSKRSSLLFSGGPQRKSVPNDISTSPPTPPTLDEQRHHTPSRPK